MYNFVAVIEFFVLNVRMFDEIFESLTWSPSFNLG